MQGEPGGQTAESFVWHTSVAVGPVGLVQVHGAEQLRGQRLGLDVQVELGQAHQQEERRRREHLQREARPARAGQRAAAARLQQQVLAQHCCKLPPRAGPAHRGGAQPRVGCCRHGRARMVQPQLLCCSQTQPVHLGSPVQGGTCKRFLAVACTKCFTIDKYVPSTQNTQSRCATVLRETTGRGLVVRTGTCAGVHLRLCRRCHLAVLYC